MDMLPPANRNPYIGRFRQVFPGRDNDSLYAARLPFVCHRVCERCRYLTAHRVPTRR